MSKRIKKLNKDKRVKKAAPILGYVIAFAATSATAAATYCKHLNDELVTKAIGKLLPALTPAEDGFWISIDGSNKCIYSIASDIARADPEIKFACAVPSSKRLVGGEVLGFEDKTCRSLIQMLTSIPDDNLSNQSKKRSLKMTEFEQTYNRNWTAPVEVLNLCECHALILDCAKAERVMWQEIRCIKKFRKAAYAQYAVQALRLIGLQDVQPTSFGNASALHSELSIKEIRKRLSTTIFTGVECHVRTRKDRVVCSIGWIK